MNNQMNMHVHFLAAREEINNYFNTVAALEKCKQRIKALKEDLQNWENAAANYQEELDSIYEGLAGWMNTACSMDKNSMVPSDTYTFTDTPKWVEEIAKSLRKNR